MMQPTILVTGATGNTGGAVVSELLHRGVPVRAMVRSRDARSAALQARGAEVVVADIFDPDQLVAAMRGVQRAYYVPPYHPYVIQSAVAFAVAVLMAPERHDGKTYRPTGPQLLSGREMAESVAKVVGHRVRPVEVPFWLFSKNARWWQGVGPFLVSALRLYVEDVRNGAFAFEGGVTETVEALTGTPAESFETTAQRYAALPFARPSLGNRIKALVKFTAAPLLPGYDLPRLERQWGFPEPQKPTFALADEAWRDEHSQLMAGQPRAGQTLRVAS